LIVKTASGDPQASGSFNIYPHAGFLAVQSILLEAWFKRAWRLGNGLGKLRQLAGTSERQRGIKF